MFTAPDTANAETGMRALGCVGTNGVSEYAILMSGYEIPLQYNVYIYYSLNPFTPTDLFSLIQNNEWKSPL